MLKTDENGEAFKDGLEYGTYLVRETAAPNGYVLDPTEKKITIGEQNAQITLTFTNWKNRFVLQKVSQETEKCFREQPFISGRKMEVLMRQKDGCKWKN